MLGGPIPFNPKVHVVRRTPFEEFVRRELNDKNLFTYWHAQSRNWLVGWWVRKDAPRFILELQVLNHDPTGQAPALTLERVKDLKDKWYCSPTIKKIKGTMRGQEQDYDNEHEAYHREYLAEGRALSRRRRLHNRSPYWDWMAHRSP